MSVETAVKSLADTYDIEDLRAELSRIGNGTKDHNIDTSETVLKAHVNEADRAEAVRAQVDPD
jgi:hypothetical protein